MEGRRGVLRCLTPTRGHSDCLTRALSGVRDRRAGCIEEAEEHRCRAGCILFISVVLSLPCSFYMHIHSCCCCHSCCCHFKSRVVPGLSIPAAVERCLSGLPHTYTHRQPGIRVRARPGLSGYSLASPKVINQPIDHNTNLPPSATTFVLFNCTRQTLHSHALSLSLSIHLSSYHSDTIAAHSCIHLSTSSSRRRQTNKHIRDKFRPRLDGVPRSDLSEATDPTTDRAPTYLF